jgi:hypothetical protein
MKNQPENKPEASVPPRIIVPGNFPVKDEKKTRLKHPRPSWWPNNNAERIALGHRVLDAIESVAAELAYEISNNYVANLRTVLTTIDSLGNWHKSVTSLGQQYTSDNNFLIEGPGFVNEPNQVIILKLDANAVATLGPVTANIECFSGLLGILIAIDTELKKCPAYLANQNFGIRLGFIKAADTKPDLTAQTFHITGERLINRKPAVKWTKGNNNGAVFLYRELTGEDTQWHPAGTYTKTPSALAIPPQAKPRVVEVQGRYLKGDDQVGDWSSPYPLTIPPAIQQAI